MKSSRLLFAPLVVLLAAPLPAQTLLINEVSPPASPLVSQTNANSFTRAFHAHSASGKHTRGQTFITPDSGDGNTDYNITGITLLKNATQSFSAGDQLELWVFEWAPTSDGSDGSAWTTTGTNGTQDGDPLSGTGMTTLLQTTFDLGDLTLTNNLYFTFDFSDTSLTFAENRAYGFLVGYSDFDGSGGNNDYLQLRETSAGATFADGAQARTQNIPSANVLTTSRDLTFWLSGSVIATTSTVFTSADAPTTGLIASNPTGGTDTALFDEDANANHARGQLFSLPDGAGSEYEISAITVKKSLDQAYLGDTITLRVFEGTQSEWDTTTAGHTTAADGDNYYVGTTVTPLHTETFFLNGLITNNHYVTFQLANPITVNEDSDFGFFMTYDQVGGTQNSFRHRENGSGGGRLSITTTGHSTSPSRKVVYFVHGTATGGTTIPEITSISTDNGTPPNITLEIQGAAGTTYDIKASDSLDDGFPKLSTSVVTNGSGYATTTFPR